MTIVGTAYSPMTSDRNCRYDKGHANVFSTNCGDGQAYSVVNAWVYLGPWRDKYIGMDAGDKNRQLILNVYKCLDDFKN